MSSIKSYFTFNYLTHLFSTYLSIAFIGNPLNQDLFPPHGFCVAVGEAGRNEWKRVRSQMTVVVFFFFLVGCLGYFKFDLFLHPNSV